MSDPAKMVLGGEATVITFVEHEVTRRELSAGNKLPTERELAQRSGQSRAAVRRALEVLEARGRVVRHVGRGTFLASPPYEGDEDTAATVSPGDILTLRALLEPQTMSLVVASATTADFDEMRRCLREGERADSYANFEIWDAALHRSFALATHNPLIVRVSDLINDARHKPLWGRLKQLGHAPERRREYELDHRAIVEALSERDASAARQAMRDHIMRVRRYMLGEEL